MRQETFINTLYYGDNLDVLRKYIKDESVDLCYIDPPFNSNRNYFQIYDNGEKNKAQTQAFIDTWTWNALSIKGYNEIIENVNEIYTLQTVKFIRSMYDLLGNTGLMAYLVSMTQRIEEIHRVLKLTGSFYLHCDTTVSHFLKLLIDSIFISRGGDFQNEIAWCYKSGGASQTKFAKKHDTIFFYSKSRKTTFNIVKEKSYMVPGSGKNPNQNYYEGEEGKRYTLTIPKDWWEIGMLATSSKERLGYPTQKPEALLERIIQASSNEGDLVLDAYCGCGTTIAVAQRLNRNWIGIDITYNSISIILKRLEDTYSKEIIDNTILNGMPKDIASAEALAHKKDDRLRKEFEKWSVLTYSNNRAYINEKKSRDGGIDGIAFMKVSENATKEILFQVKTNKTINPTIVRDLYGTLERDSAAIGILITLYPMDNLKKEAMKYGEFENKLFGISIPRIQVVTAEEIMRGERLKLPAMQEVLKSAPKKEKSKQIKLN